MVGTVPPDIRGGGFGSDVADSRQEETPVATTAKGRAPSDDIAEARRILSYDVTDEYASRIERARAANQARRLTDVQREDLEDRSEWLAGYDDEDGQAGMMDQVSEEWREVEMGQTVETGMVVLGQAAGAWLAGYDDDEDAQTVGTGQAPEEWREVEMSQTAEETWEVELALEREENRRLLQEKARLIEMLSAARLAAAPATAATRTNCVITNASAEVDEGEEQGDCLASALLTTGRAVSAMVENAVAARAALEQLCYGLVLFSADMANVLGPPLQDLVQESGVEAMKQAQPHIDHLRAASLVAGERLRTASLQLQEQAKYAQKATSELCCGLVLFSSDMAAALVGPQLARMRASSLATQARLKSAARLSLIGPRESMRTGSAQMKAHVERAREASGEFTRLLGRRWVALVVQTSSGFGSAQRWICDQSMESARLVKLGLVAWLYRYDLFVSHPFVKKNRDGAPGHILAHPALPRTPPSHTPQDLTRHRGASHTSSRRLPSDPEEY